MPADHIFLIEVLISEKKLSQRFSILPSDESNKYAPGRNLHQNNHEWVPPECISGNKTRAHIFDTRVLFVLLVRLFREASATGNDAGGGNGGGGGGGTKNTANWFCFRNSGVVVITNKAVARGRCVGS